MTVKDVSERCRRLQEAEDRASIDAVIRTIPDWETFHAVMQWATTVEAPLFGRLVIFALRYNLGLEDREALQRAGFLAAETTER